MQIHAGYHTIIINNHSVIRFQITSLCIEERYWLIGSVMLRKFVCLSVYVCGPTLLKMTVYERALGCPFYGRVLSSTRKN